MIKTIIIGVLICIGWMLVQWVWYVVRLRKWLRRATVEDIMQTDEFAKWMQSEIDRLLDERARVQAQIGADGHLKSHPIEHLQDEGVFNAKDMTELYRHFLQKTLIDYSHNDRKFIGEVGSSVYSLTIRELLNRACMDVRRKA
jgi:hypothetical protein